MFPWEIINQLWLSVNSSIDRDNFGMHSKTPSARKGSGSGCSGILPDTPTS